MSLVVTIQDLNIPRLAEGEATLITSLNYYDTPLITATNAYNETIKNVSLYFAPNGDASLFNFLVAGEYLKLCKSIILSGNNFDFAFTNNYSVSASFGNSIANKLLIPATTVGIYRSSTFNGDVGNYPAGYIPSYYSLVTPLNQFHRIRYDIQIPKTTQRSSISGSIDAIYVYTYTT